MHIQSDFLLKPFSVVPLFLKAKFLFKPNVLFLPLHPHLVYHTPPVCFSHTDLSLVTDSHIPFYQFTQQIPVEYYYIMGH